MLHLRAGIVEIIRKFVGPIVEHPFRVIIQELLNGGADPNLPDLNEAIPFSAAVDLGDCQLIRSMLDAGAMPELLNAEQHAKMRQILPGRMVDEWAPLSAEERAQKYRTIKPVAMPVHGQQQQPTDDEWVPGFEFYCVGDYDTYGRAIIDGAERAIGFNENHNDNVVAFARGGQRVWAKTTTEAFCYGACYSPETFDEKNRFCRGGISGAETKVYTAMPTSSSTPTLPPFMSTPEQYGAAFERIVAEVKSQGLSRTECESKVELLLQDSSLDVRIAYVEALVDAGPKRLLAVFEPVIGYSFAPEMLNGAGGPLGFSFNGRPPLVYAAVEMGSCAAVEALLALGATRGAAGAGRTLSAAAHSGKARKDTITGSTTRAAASSSGAALELLDAHLEEWAPVVAELQAKILALREPLDDERCNYDRDGLDPMGDDFVESLLLKAYVLWVAVRGQQY